MASLDPTTVSPGYRALIEATGMVDLTGRTQLELTGEDRATFLHNFCTNSVRNLNVGSGVEAFILNAKGHVLGHVFIFSSPSSLIVDAVPGQGDRLKSHLDRYILRERVAILDRTGNWGVLLIAGPQAAALLESLALSVSQDRLSHNQSVLMGHAVYLRRVDLVGPDSWQLVCPRDAVESISGALVNAGVVRAEPADFEMARIEAGMPLYARDISESNLPQEVNRDAQAISFTKGCYLGQETVARIDALGHVNRVLVGVRFAGDKLPAAGTELVAGDAQGREGKAPIGAVTSAAHSPRLGAPLALAYLRRGHTHSGAKLDSPVGPAEVIPLPL